MFLIKKIFDYLIWLMFFGFLLLGGIIFVSNRTYPGDDLYSFKLKFESFALATSKILNKQVDFSIDLVSKRSSEVAKILTPKNSGETLSRLDTQVESTAVSIAQISDPIEKKKAATKYIAKLNEVSSVLSEKQKEFIITPTAPNTIIQPVVQQPTGQQIQDQPIQPTKQNTQIIFPTTTLPLPSPTLPPEVSEISQQIDNSQENIQQTIDEMNEIADQPTIQEAPIPTNIPESIEEREKDKEKERKKDKKKERDED